MRLLVVGGCGLVGSMVVPRLAERHEVRVLDLAEPAEPVPGVAYHQGDLHDVELITELATGVDSLVFMAMGPVADWGSPRSAHKHFDVAVTGLYLTLMGAHEAGVGHVVFTSSMSVHRYPGRGKDFPKPLQQADDEELVSYPDESVPPNAGDFYGFAKRLGEEVCRNATVEWGMDAVVLRLCFPTPDEKWPRHSGTAMQRVIATSGRDVAGAIEAALHYRGKGFEPFAISGDGAERTMSLAKARTELNWHPQDPTP